MTGTIKAYSQRQLPPYTGQVQIAESERARAVTMDGETWEIHFLFSITDGDSRFGGKPRRTFRRAALVSHSDLRRLSQQSSVQNREIDERILELADFLANASLPFPATDIYEYWLLDHEDKAPLALIFTCTDPARMADFPSHPEWTALPAVAMPVDATDEEKQRGEPPVNYRLERLVAERAGPSPRACWLMRRASDPDSVPPLLLREDWQEAYQHELCRRYLARLAPRLLMLHWLNGSDRRRLELAATANVFEVERFYPLYPEVADEELMSAMRVEARLRGAAKEPAGPRKRGGGIRYL